MIFRRQTKPLAEPTSQPEPAAISKPSGMIALGVDIEAATPFTFPQKLLGHMHIRGMTRSGKTSLTLIPLCYQLLIDDARSLFVFDLKGDTNLYHHVKRAAAKQGRTFKYLVVDAVSGLDTYHFPPFQMLPAEGNNILAMAETLIQAFGMDHGMVYGGSYYQQQNLGALLYVCTLLRDQMRNPTFADVSNYLRKNAKRFRDAAQVEMTFSFLTETPALAPHPNPKRNIDLRRAIDEGHVVYVWARTMRQAMTARLVAGLVLYSLIAVAQERSTLGESAKRVYVVIDEFQQLVSSSFADVMAQCGAWMSLILSNQSTSQLKNRDLSLADFIAENVSIRQRFTSVGRDDVEELQSLSKDKIRSLGGTSVQGMSTSVSLRDTIVPALERDTISEVSQTFGRSFVIVNDGLGFRPPTIVQQVHEYEDLSHVPMPRKASEDSGDVASERVSQNRVEPVPPDTGSASARKDRIASLIARKIAEESWELLPGARKS